MAAAQCYNLKVGGQIVWDLTEADILELFRCGRIDSSTPCRVSGRPEWRNVNEYFPLLKYGAVAWVGNSSDLPLRVGDRVRASTRRWKMGILCFALGLGCAGAVTLLPWRTFPPEVSRRPASYVQAAQPLQADPGPQGEIVQAQGSAGLGQRMLSDSQRLQPVYTSPSRPIQRVVRNRIAANPQPVSKPQVQPEEFTIPLDRWTTVTSTYGSFHVMIRDHGPVTISVWLNSANPRRIEKEKGFETTGTNIVQIHSLGGAKVYYVDRIGVSVGHCVLKVIPNS